jgi:hypothetical protein
MQPELAGNSRPNQKAGGQNAQSQRIGGILQHESESACGSPIFGGKLR